MQKLLMVLTALVVFFLSARAVEATPAASSSARSHSVSTTTPGGTTLTMGTYTGAEYGLAKELVYYTGSGYTYYKVSELDWPLEPMFLGGARFSLDTPFGLMTSVNVSSGIPADVGTITDSDYLNGDGLRTHFSEHTATLEHSVSARVDLGWQRQLSSSFSLALFGRYLYRDIKWSAHDGYLQYPPQSSPPYTDWSPSTAKVYLYGLVALYQQIYSIPAVGLRGEYRINDKLLVKGSVAYSPFAYANDIDNHILRSLIFFDSVSQATYLEPSLSVSFKPSSSFALTLDLSYMNVVSPKNGTTSAEDTTTGTVTSYAGTGSTAGMTIHSFNSTLGLRLAF